MESCFDDSDNEIAVPYVNRTISNSTILMRNVTRGSLPIVILNKWEELSADLLEREWRRITSYPLTHWDWRRLFADHWFQRIGRFD